MDAVKSAATPSAAGAAAGAAAAAPAPNVAALAKGALRRLAQAQLEPTPDNYARAYAEEAGLKARTEPAAVAAADTRAPDTAWAALLERLAKNLERGGRQWTAARRKESLNHVFSSNRSDAQRLLLRLQALMTAWETDKPADTDSGSSAGADAGPSDALVAAVTAAVPATPVTAPTAPTAPMVGGPIGPAGGATSAAAVSAAASKPPAWRPLLSSLHRTLQAALEAGTPASAPQTVGDVAQRLAVLADAVAADGPTAAHVAAIESTCLQARRWLLHRHHLVDELQALCLSLTHGLVELTEDDSWARGQCSQLQAALSAEMPGRYGAGDVGGDRAATDAAVATGDAVPSVPDGVTRAADAPVAGPSVRGLRAAGAMLAETRQRHRQVRGERQAARAALKSLIHGMLQEVDALGDRAGRFHSAAEQHAQAIEQAIERDDTLASLATVVQAMLQDTRSVQAAVSASQARLLADRASAALLEDKVRALEAELRRMSEEVSTDALTQVANRRGLAQAFDAESARCEREVQAAAAAGHDSPAALAVGLIDIDNFKRLNDSLGHAAGDRALKALAAAVRDRLRPADHVARFGGEEFVVLLPGTPLAEAQQVLIRLQRGLSEALFLHDGREVFVTFSAGVTQWQSGEALQTTLERADEALYEAKRSGKNRTCTL